MKTKTLPAHAVRAGMSVFVAGCVYAVESNLFDRHGKGPNQSLSILVCKSAPDRHGYCHGEHFGFLPSTQVMVIQANA